MTSLFEPLWNLLRGDTAYWPYAERSVCFTTGRVRIVSQFAVYRKYGGLFQPTSYRNGVMTLDVVFNPGMAPVLFEAFTQADAVSCLKFVPLDALQEVLEGGEFPEIGLRLSTLLRQTGDTRDVHAYIELLTDAVHRRPKQYGGPMRKQEYEALRILLNHVSDWTFGRCQEISSY